MQGTSVTWTKCRGVSLQDVWTDIRPAQGAERLSYPTQKPLALLERIIRSSSNEGDTILDPSAAVERPLQRPRSLIVPGSESTSPASDFFGPIPAPGFLRQELPI